MAQQCISDTAPTLTLLVKKYTPCQGVVCSKYRLTGTFHVPLDFGVVLFAKVCFFTSAVLQSCRFYTGFIVPKLQVTISHELQLQFQYFLQIPIARSLYYTTVVIRRPKFWGPNFYSPFFSSISSVFMKT